MFWLAHNPVAVHLQQTCVNPAATQARRDRVSAVLGEQSHLLGFGKGLALTTDSDQELSLRQLQRPGQSRDCAFGKSTVAGWLLFGVKPWKAGGVDSLPGRNTAMGTLSV